LKDKLITILKLVISLGLMSYFFYLFLSNPSDRQVLVTSFTHANYWYWGLALVFYVLAIFSNAYKWQILLKAQGVRVPFMALTSYTFVGFFFTNFLPSNVGGDVIRGFGLARYTDRAADAAVSVVVDRIIGLMAFMISAVVAALIAVQVIASGRATGLSDNAILNETLMQNLTKVEVTAFIGLFIIVAVFGVMLSHRLRSLVGGLFAISLLKPLAPIYHQLSDAFGAYRHQYRALLGAIVVGLANPLLTGLVDLAILAGLKEQINPLYVFLFNPIIAFALIVPLSIGGLGAMSALYIYFYRLVGITEATAFALSLIKQLIIYIGSIPGGLLWLRRQRKAEPEPPRIAVHAD
jgi:uncharacterized protein (TIRG00374 family)